MNAITIPKNMKSAVASTKGEKSVIIPHSEYENFFRWRKSSQRKSKKSVKVFTPSLTLKKDLARAREDYKQGKYITLDELKQKLAIED